MAGEKVCPHCRNAVVPIVQPGGTLLCPLCGNTGVVKAAPSLAPALATAPAAVPAAPSYGLPPMSAPPGQQPWAPGTAMAPQENAPGAVAALVLGIVSFLPYVGIVTGWIAIVMGNSALRNVRSFPGRYAGEGMAQAGRILGIIALCLYLAVILLAAIVFVLVANLSRRGF